MNFIAEWFRRVWHLLNRSRMEEDLRPEMETHRSMMGSPVRFGNMLRLREEARDSWGWTWLDSLSRDLRHSLRGMQREPAFALTVILTLALGIATMTTVFTVADSELWRPLPFPHPDQLVAIYSQGPGKNAPTNAISGPELLNWRTATPGLTDIAAAAWTSRRTLQLDTAQSVLVQEVTPNYLATLGREPIHGGMPPAVAGAPRIGILTDRAWSRVFDEDDSILGRTVMLDAEPMVIAAVIPANDSLGRDPDSFLAFDETAPAFLNRNNGTFYSAVGRLKPGVGAAVARVQLQAAFADRPGNVFVGDLHDQTSGNNWRPLYFFLGAALLVLLLTVVNVATLLLARAFRRTKEFALRGALGGSRRALARQLLVEGGLFAAGGAVAGGLLTMWAVEFFASQFPADFLMRGERIPIDIRVWAFLVLMTCLIAGGFLLAPLIPLRRFDLSTVLNAGGRTGRSATEGRWRGLLLIVQVGLTVVLLFGAGVFLKSFIALANLPLGFDAENTAAARATLSGPAYASDAAVRAYADRLLEGARAIPGVSRAAVASSSPLGSGPPIPFGGAGAAVPPAGEPSSAILRSVSPGYFQTLGIRIQQGREFVAADADGAPRVAIVNETLARRTFGSEDPLGRVIDLLPGARGSWTRKPGAVVIVGVASNVKEVGLNEVEFTDIYLPFAQAPAPSVELIVRTQVAPATIIAPLRKHAELVDPAIPVTSASTFEQRVANAFQGDRFNLLLIASFAGVALLVAAVGVYGAVAYNVQQRTRELGVRLALGARPSRLVGGVLWQAARFGIVGGGLGVAGTRALAAITGDALFLVPGSHNGLLFGVTTTDPWMLAAVFLGIVLVATFAASIPAGRLARLDPVRALRSE